MSIFAGIPGITPFLYNHIICCQGNHAISLNQSIFSFQDNCLCTQVVSLNKLAHIRNELSWEFNVGTCINTPCEQVYQMVFCLKFRFVSFLQFQSCRDRAMAMLVLSVLFSELMCLAQGHKMAPQ